MTKLEKMELANSILSRHGLKEQSHYIWSLQGPTLIYLGTQDPFKGLTLKGLEEIESLGVKFLTQPKVEDPC